MRLCNSIILQLKIPELNFASMFTIFNLFSSSPIFFYFMVIPIKLFYQKPTSHKGDFFTCHHIYKDFLLWIYVFLGPTSLTSIVFQVKSVTVTVKTVKAGI